MALKNEITLIRCIFSRPSLTQVNLLSSPLSCLVFVLSFPPFYSIHLQRQWWWTGHCKLLSMRMRINLITKMCTSLRWWPDRALWCNETLGIGGGEKGIIIEMFRHIALQLTWGRDFQSPFYTFFHPTNCFIYFYNASRVCNVSLWLQHCQLCIFLNWQCMSPDVSVKLNVFIL